MKDTNGKTITEEEFMKDIGHGVERTQENWKEAFETEFGIHFLESRGELQFAIAFIETLLAEERNKVLEEVEKEVEKLRVVLDDSDGQSNVEKMLFKEDISTIINNLK